MLPLLCFALNRVRRGLQWSITTLHVTGTCLVFLLYCGSFLFASDTKPPASCTFSDDKIDPSVDVHALEQYEDAIAHLLKEEQFAELDCLADAARSRKARFSGGTWQLVNLYSGLETPRPGHPTQEDWQDHLRLLEKWTSRNPDSVTARIALAESYIAYAWDARGAGYSDSVSGSGWKLFDERLEKAKQTLDGASTLPTKCPEWYLAMLDVAQGLGWDLDRETALFEQAIAFEPAFQSYYRNHAVQLLPKWNGQEGDAAGFAEQAANRVGGEAGDILYFQIAAKLVCACEDREFSHLSWPRVQNGFAALEKKYGPSLGNTNSFALMATNAQDEVAADAAFKRIGEQWDKDVWRTEEWFKQNRDAAAQIAPREIHGRQIRQEAQNNLKTPEGPAYQTHFEQKLLGIERLCVDRVDEDHSKFEVLIQVANDGVAQDLLAKHPTSFGRCLMQVLYASHVKKEALFPPPPRPSYWVILEIDPTILKAAAQ